MYPANQQAREVESSFLTGVQAGVQAVAGRLLAGSWFERGEFDFAEQLRAAMVNRRIFDRELFAQLPHSRGLAVRGYERRWIFGKRLRSVTIAGVLAPPEAILGEGNTASPVNRAQLTDYLAGLTKEGGVPQVIGVCSPSGFEDDIRSNPPALPNVKLVLIEPRQDGGWRVTATDKGLDERLVRLFDPEQVNQKLARVQRELDNRSSDLLSGGLSAKSLARQLDVPLPLVQQAFEMQIRENPELRIARQSEDFMLFRGAPVLAGEENSAMSLAGWIKGLFSREGEEAKKINVLSERRAELSGRLDRLYEDIAKLEKRESQLLQEGRDAPSSVAKRRVAGQIARLRQDMSRCHTSSSMLNKQINIISTHIHNLELARTGSVAQLPTSEELTEAAVNAEEIIEQLNANEELVSSLDVNMAETSISAEEASILAELNGGDRPPEKNARQRIDSTPTRAKDTGEQEKGSAQAE